MTASERLTELNAGRLGWTDKAHVLVGALPAIAAVVAAAEESCGETGATDETAESCSCTSCAIARALVDLNRVLGDKP